MECHPCRCRHDQLVDTYNGCQRFHHEHVCGDDWTIREIPSEGYLLDSTVYPIGAAAKHRGIS